MLSLFHEVVLDEILNLIESVSEGFSFLLLLKTDVVHIVDVFETPRHELLLRYVQFGT